jgi:integrase
MGETAKRKKAGSGTVVIRSVGRQKDRLQLVWSYAGKRYFFNLGLLDNRINRLVAQSKASVIEADLATSNFDPTLNKYRDEVDRHDRIPVWKVFHRFVEHKAKRLDKRTLDKYQAVQGRIKNYFGEKDASSIKERDAEGFRRSLSELDPETQKRYLGLLKACWQWAEGQGFVGALNPWKEPLAAIRVPPKQRPKPFTRNEAQQILEAFRNHRHYQHYADYVEFMLGTGCRPGEGIGLQWKHVADDFRRCGLERRYREEYANQRRLMKNAPFD